LKVGRSTRFHQLLSLVSFHRLGCLSNTCRLNVCQEAADEQASDHHAEEER
jgi:hypothetical protein